MGAAAHRWRRHGDYWDIGPKPEGGTVSDYDRHMAEMDRLNPPLVRGEDYHEALERAMLAVEDERDALAERVAELTGERDALEREVMRLREIAAGVDDGGRWYSHQTMQAVATERDALRGEVAQLRAVLERIAASPDGDVEPGLGSHLRAAWEMVQAARRC